MLLRWWQATPRPLAWLGKRSNAADLPTEASKHLLKSGVGAGFSTKMVALPKLDAGQLVKVAVEDMPVLYREGALVQLSRRESLSLTAAAVLSHIEKVAEVCGLCI